MKRGAMIVLLIAVILLSGGILWDIKKNRPEWLDFSSRDEKSASSSKTENEVVSGENDDKSVADKSEYTTTAPTEKGVLPMSQRVAVLGVLNKKTGKWQDIILHTGEMTHFPDIIIKLEACEETMPWEAEHLTGAFVQVESLKYNHRWQKIFSGWLYKEAPSLNVIESPNYDVWPKSCTMRAPSGRSKEKEPAPAAAPVKSSPSAKAKVASPEKRD